VHVLSSLLETVTPKAQCWDGCGKSLAIVILYLASPQERTSPQEQTTHTIYIIISHRYNTISSPSEAFSGLTPRELKEHGIRTKSSKALQAKVEQLKLLRLEAATYKNRVVGHVFLSSGLFLYTEDSSIWPSEPSYRGRRRRGTIKIFTIFLFPSSSCPWRVCISADLVRHAEWHYIRSLIS